MVCSLLPVLELKPSMKTESSETHSVFHAQNNILSLLSVSFECILYLTRIMSWGSLTHTCFKALAHVTAHVLSCGSTTLRTTSKGPTALMPETASAVFRNEEASQKVKGRWTVFISQKSVQLSFFQALKNKGNLEKHPNASTKKRQLLMFIECIADMYCIKTDRNFTLFILQQQRH